MQVFYNIHELKLKLAEYVFLDKTIGFVPTMGALHDGHVSLINFSKKQCDITVCSIFVNPTQFNNLEDLAHYPKTPENDILLLTNAGCDFLYMPSVDDIYPTDFNRTFHFGYLETILEGSSRAGHFNGVGQVVSVLLEGIKPHKAFFGSKDYQQVMVVKALVKQLNLPIEIVSCPILRESDGLAMSSRNMRLNAQERKVAALIPKLMNEVIGMIELLGIEEAKKWMTHQIENEPLMTLDYFEICDAESLHELKEYDSTVSTVLLIAIFVGKIRLIDNLIMS
jgi:pantoate--beta-alanine ligase